MGDDTMDSFGIRNLHDGFELPFNESVNERASSLSCQSGPSAPIQVEQSGPSAQHLGWTISAQQSGLSASKPNGTLSRRPPNLVSDSANTSQLVKMHKSTGLEILKNDEQKGRKKKDRRKIINPNEQEQSV